MRIEGATVLVTGSTGFLGSHLIHSLAQNKRTRVRGLVKPTLSGINQFDGLPVEKVFGDIMSIEDMQKATRGCDVVVHCALDKLDVTATGTRNVIRAATQHRVKRFIHISSTAVFGYYPSIKEAKDGRLPAGAGIARSKKNYYSDYCQSKITSERIAFSYYDSCNLPLVILRPSNIFGPSSLWWTVKPIEMLRKGCYVLINGGLTPSNTVYVNNVVDSIMLAIKEDNAVGHALIISSDQNTSWKKFFSHYAKMFSSPPALLNITLNELKRERDRQYLELFKKVFSNPKQNAQSIPALAAQSPFINSLIPLIYNFYIKSRIGELIPSIVKRVTLAKTEEGNKVEHTINKLPNFWMEKTFTLPFNFPIKGAAEILGFKPRVSLENGMKKIKDWLADWSTASFVSPLETYAASDLIVSELARPKRARVR